MSAAKTVVLRHRESGYLRFDLPETLCTSYASEELHRELLAIDGVYRVGLIPRSGKLAIRFHAAFCSFEKLIRTLFALVKRIIGRTETKPSTARGMVPAGPRRVSEPASFLPSSSVAWLKAKAVEIQETFLALKILFLRSIEHRPRWAQEFMNDLLTLFLIKLHWHQILTEWLPRPWTFRYEWMATLYMVYLSVQSRMPQAA